MLIHTINSEFRNLTENVTTVRIFEKGHEIEDRPTLYLAPARDDGPLLDHASRAGLQAEVSSRRTFLKVATALPALP